MQKTPQDKLFETLIDEELPKLRGLAFRILKNAADVDEDVRIYVRGSEAEHD